jgi:hypothetical protein
LTNHVSGVPSWSRTSHDRIDPITQRRSSGQPPLWLPYRRVRSVHPFPIGLTRRESFAGFRFHRFHRFDSQAVTA